MLQVTAKYKVICGLVAILLGLSGCGNDTTIVLTTGFAQNEVFKIESSSCTTEEVYVYLTNMQNQYENVFGAQLWEKEVNGISLEENIKENVLAKIAQVKSLNLLAAQQDITLSDEELVLAKAAAVEYYQSLNETEIQILEITEAKLELMYQEYFLAEKVYYNSIREINPEVSDDEARIVLVQQIILKTYDVGANNIKIPFGTLEKAAVYESAQSILTMAQDAQSYSFESLATLYSDSDILTYSISKGEYEFTIEEAAFSLDTNAISSIVESSEGYHIIKCISSFNQEETDLNKEKIIEARKKEAFLLVYDEFVNNLTRNLNTKVWEEIEMTHIEEIQTDNFLEIADKYYGIDF